MLHRPVEHRHDARSHQRRNEARYPPSNHCKHQHLCAISTRRVSKAVRVPPTKESRRPQSPPLKEHYCVNQKCRHSSQDDMAPKGEPKVKSSSCTVKQSNRSTSLREKKSPTEAKDSSKPVATIVPKSQTRKTQVESDLAISSSDTDAEPARTTEPPPESDWEEWTDVEPDDDTMIAIKLSGRPRLKARPPPVYTQADNPIEIEDEPATPQPIPTPPPTSETAPIAASTAPLDTIAAPAPTTSTAPVHVPTGDPTVRHATRPSRPYAPLLRKLRMTPPIPQPIVER